MKTLKLIFRSLIKNDSCVEGGRTYPWWVALIFFFVSTIISVIPLTVTAFTTDYGVIIKNATFDTDKALYQVIKNLETDGIDLQFHTSKTTPDKFEADPSLKSYVTVTVNGQVAENQNYDLGESGVIVGKVSDYQTTSGTITAVSLPSISEEVTTPSEEPTVAPTETPTTKSLKASATTPTEVPSESATTAPTEVPSTSTTGNVEKDHTLLRVYFLAEEGYNSTTQKNTFDEKVKIILSGQNPYTTEYEESYHGNSSYHTNRTSFIAFGKNEMSFYKYKYNGVAYQQVKFTYRDVEFKTLTSIKGETFSSTIDNAANFFRQAANENKLNSAGIQISIYLSINAGIIALMGLVLFLMTRGKNNPYNFYKFHECLKISCWTAFTPSLLAMVFGFMFGAQNALSGFLFILLFGMRSMWLAMKNFKPVQ